MQSNYVQEHFAPGSSRGPRSLRTLALQMAKELSEAEHARRKAIGERIRELRDRRPQPRIAEHVGVTLRAYQAWEAGDSGIGYDNLMRLADVLDTTPEYIEYGTAGRPRPHTDLGRVEAKLDALLIHAGIDPGAFDTSGVADIEGAAAGSIELLAGEDEGKPPKRQAPARKKRAS